MASSRATGANRPQAAAAQAGRNAEHYQMQSQPSLTKELLLDLDDKNRLNDANNLKTNNVIKELKSDDEDEDRIKGAVEQYCNSSRPMILQSPTVRTDATNKHLLMSN